MINFLVVGAVIGLILSYDLMRQDEIRRNEFLKPDETIPDLLNEDFLLRKETLN
jgi:hypothetical protein